MKALHLAFFALWTLFSYAWIYSLRKKCPYLVKMRENTDQNNSKYGHFSRSDS